MVAVDVLGTERPAAQGTQGLLPGRIGSGVGKIGDAGAARHLPHIEARAAF
jgi:hypothetical protein